MPPPLKSPNVISHADPRTRKQTVKRKNPHQRHQWKTVFGGDIGGPRAAKTRGHKSAATPEDIIQKPRSIGAKRPTFVVDNVFALTT